MAGSDDRRARLAKAGEWLRAARARRYPKAADFARDLDISTSLLSRYETGGSEVPDDKAERIAQALGLDIIEVRRNLGLWVPAGDPPAEMTDEEHEAILSHAEDLARQAQELMRRIQESRSRTETAKPPEK